MKIKFSNIIKIVGNFLRLRRKKSSDMIFVLQKSGFTLVELLVSVSIFVIMTVIVAYNYSNFNNSIIVTNYAYDVALALRQAQIYGLSVSKTSGNFQSGYGIHFNLATPNTFILFADSQTVGTVNVRDSGEVPIETFTFPSSYKISTICAANTSTSSCTTNPVLDVVFLRPDPDAKITLGGVPTPLYGFVSITLMSPTGITKTVTVQGTGQISVK